MTMSSEREQLIDWIEKDREALVEFLRDFVRQKGPNPPGDTRSTADYVKARLDREGCSYRIIDPNPEMPNIVGSFAGGKPGKHLVLNGHIDVFPVADDGLGWSKDPWGGELIDGKIYGRGVADMKCGTTASIFSEKGPLWIEFSVLTAGAHGAYTHAATDAERTGWFAIEACVTMHFRMVFHEITRAVRAECFFVRNRREREAPFQAVLDAIEVDIGDACALRI